MPRLCRYTSTAQGKTASSIVAVGIRPAYEGVEPIARMDYLGRMDTDEQVRSTEVISCSSRDEQRIRLAHHMITCAAEDIRDAKLLLDQSNHRNALILMLQASEKSFKAIMLHIDPQALDGYFRREGFGQKSTAYLHELPSIREALETSHVKDSLLAASLLRSIDQNLESIGELISDVHLYNNLRYPRPVLNGVRIPAVNRPPEAAIHAFFGMVEIGKACIQLIPFVTSSRNY